jgi:hypothetical protein
VAAFIKPFLEKTPIARPSKIDLSLLSDKDIIRSHSIDTGALVSLGGFTFLDDVKDKPRISGSLSPGA